MICIAAGQNALYMFQLIICLYNIIFSVVISYNNVHEFTNNLLTIKALTRMKSESENLKILAVYNFPFMNDSG